MKTSLGACYYPEHWPQSQWAEDARRMLDLGLQLVRIGEFAWSRIEPAPGDYQWGWLDQAIETLGESGLKVVLGTPTATPPRWMLDRHPDMLAVDAEGRPRKFGSRRHYCFSHAGYRDDSAVVAELMARRYGRSQHLHSWQIDNEYGCHDTVVSYSVAAAEAFRAWLDRQYATIAALNSAWGNVFWSMEYDDFGQIELPNLTVTEPNPAHVMDFRRFSSDQVIRYNLAQARVIRQHSDAPLIHNYMGRITDFDHFRLGDDLDIASWDSYPLGFLADRSDAEESRQQHFYRQGEPDFQAFHHDLYRAAGKGRWWVMEQQPGPVNWAPFNPAPLPNMVRLWTWEAIAHQAEAVCYFRWRQAPFAQEQMHAGLLRPDSKEMPVFNEVRQVAREIEQVGPIEAADSKIGLVFDYQSCWAWQCQPQGQSFDYFSLQLAFYRGLRRLGLSIDILPSSVQSFSGYSLVIIPGMMYWNDDLRMAMDEFDGTLLVGPRSGSKTRHFAIPENLPPDLPGIDCRVSYVESLRQGARRDLEQGGFIHSWLECIEGTARVVEKTADGQAALVADTNTHYLAGWPDDEAMLRILQGLCSSAGIETTSMPPGLRQRQTGSHFFRFNYNGHPVDFGGVSIPAAGVIWETI